ncbi:MAG: histidine phosphatase family protein [Chloroflexi bacterium]|nr:histidine phosphatase family protein [Chloroflexota bacterium]
MIIHLVRHGQPQMGRDGLYVPSAGLTQLGNRQAIQAAERILEIKPEATFTSNVPRAVESAAHFTTISNQPAHQIDDLAELKTGNIWDAPDDIKRKITTGDYHVDFKSMGGETISEFSKRAITGFSQLKTRCASLRLNNVAAFLHEGVIGTIIDHLEGRKLFEPQRRVRMPYGALITLDTDSGAPHFPGCWETKHLDEISC